MESIIIGAGITGLSTAYHLKNGYVILERENKVGGLCSSVNSGKYIFDYTGHSIHLRTSYAKSVIFNLLKKNILERNRDAWIHSNSVFTRYPYQANLYGLPKNVIKECILGLIEARISASQSKSGSTCFDDITLKEWVLNKFGKGFAKHFFFPYNKKLWTVDPNTLTTAWVAPFVPQPDIEEVIMGTFSDDKKRYGYNSTFFYPESGGIQSLPDALNKRLSNVRLNSKVNEVDWKRKIVVYNDKKLNYENLVSTMPLPELLSRMKDLPADISGIAENLKWNSIYCINLGINNPGILGKKHWVYFPERKYIFYRIGCYHNFSKKLVPKNASSLYVEVAFRNKQEFHRGPVLKKIFDELKAGRILNNSDKIEEINILPIPCAYVIYDKNRKKALEVIDKFMKSNNIFSIGRYGAWKYSYIEESIIDGKSTAELINQRNHNNA